MTNEKQCDYPNCEKVKNLVKHKENLTKENQELRQMLIDNGILKAAIKVNVSRKA